MKYFIFLFVVYIYKFGYIYIYINFLYMCCICVVYLLYIFIVSPSNKLNAHHAENPAISNLRRSQMMYKTPLTGNVGFLFWWVWFFFCIKFFLSEKNIVNNCSFLWKIVLNACYFCKLTTFLNPLIKLKLLIFLKKIHKSLTLLGIFTFFLL